MCQWFKTGHEIMILSAFGTVQQVWGGGNTRSATTSHWILFQDSPKDAPSVARFSGGPMLLSGAMQNSSIWTSLLAASRKALSYPSWTRDSWAHQKSHATCPQSQGAPCWGKGGQGLLAGAALGSGAPTLSSYISHKCCFVADCSS